jgi:ubiquinone biosynthesis protein
LRRHQIQLPSNTFLLLKTIVMAQSLGRGLDPEFNIAPMLESYVIAIIKKKYSLSAAFRRMPAAAAELASLVGGLPQRLDRMMKTAERGELHVSADVFGVEKQLDHLEHIVNSTVIVIVGAAFFVGLALFLVWSRMGR